MGLRIDNRNSNKNDLKELYKLQEATESELKGRRKELLFYLAEREGESLRLKDKKNYNKLSS